MNCLGLKNSIVKIYLELFVPNKHKRSLLKAKWAKNNIKKYAEIALSNPENFKKTEEQEAKIIWQYWHQGEKNAPELIKKCLESTKKHYPDYQVIVLDFNSIKDYIQLPERYYGLLKKKKIPIAIFSDILRLYLLSKYGGMWVDSTMYSTGKLPDEILNSSFFVFQKDQTIDPMGNCMSCYFIKAKKNSFWINVIKQALEEYWSENNYLVNYFLFEHMVTILANALKEKWDKIPYFKASVTCDMQFNFHQKYNEEKFKNILNTIPIHKLTYKNFPNEIPNDTFGAKLLQL